MKYLLSYNRIFSGACFDCYFWRRLGDCCCDRCRRNNIGALGDKPNKQIESRERVRESENVPRTTMVDHFDERKMSLSFYWKINESDMISPLFPLPPASIITIDVYLNMSGVVSRPISATYFPPSPIRWPASNLFMMDPECLGTETFISVLFCQPANEA